MRITFLTGSLEPGKDGVGDYTRLLAGECTRLGARCLVIALADRYVDRALVQTASGIDTVRLPAALPWTIRLSRLHRVAQSFGPAWVSLQYVPYSFHPKGLPIRLARALPRLIHPARFHVMLHELWNGGDGSWPNGLIGAGQRWCALRLCHQPGTVVHTSNRTYRKMLEECGVRALCLPLFGSIPVSASAAAWLPTAFAEAGFGPFAHRADWWLFGLFGTLHPEWPPEPLLPTIQRAAAARGKKIALVSVGRQGPGEQVWNGIATRYSSEFPIVRLGEQAPERVSEVLNTVDFGVATSPYSLVGKSATVAAMLEHGLPIIVNREDGPPAPEAAAGVPDSDRLIRLDSRFEERLAHVTRHQPLSRLNDVSVRFLAALGHT